MIDFENIKPEYKDLVKNFLKENSKNQLTKFLQTYFSIKDNESIYCLLYDIKEKPKCPTCGKDLLFLSILRGYRKFCSPKCSNSNKQKIEKGVAWYKDKNRVKLAKDKTKQTCLKKYGKEFYVQTSEFSQKARNSTFQHYGVYNSAQKSFTNFEDLNKDFIVKHFIKDGYLLKKEICTYFNMKYEGYNAWMARLGLFLPNYKNNNVSIGEKEWLSACGVPDTPESRQVTVNGYRIDGKDDNILYEYLGDFWHGNLKIFNPDDINPKNKLTFKELYNRILQKFINLSAFGYTILYIWESEHQICIKNKTVHANRFSMKSLDILPDYNFDMYSWGKPQVVFEKQLDTDMSFILRAKKTYNINGKIF